DAGFSRDALAAAVSPVSPDTDVNQVVAVVLGQLDPNLLKRVFPDDRDRPIQRLSGEAILRRLGAAQYADVYTAGERCRPFYFSRHGSCRLRSVLYGSGLQSVEFGSRADEGPKFLARPFQTQPPWMEGSRTKAPVRGPATPACLGVQRSHCDRKPYLPQSFSQLAAGQQSFWILRDRHRFASL